MMLYSDILGIRALTISPSQGSGLAWSLAPASYHFIYQFSEWARLRHHPSIFLEFTNCEQYTITIKPITRMNLAAQMTALPSKRDRAGNRNPGTQALISSPRSAPRRIRRREKLALAQN